MIQYKIDTLNLLSDGSVKSDCADITFYNSGTTTVVLNNSLSIASGTSISITANVGEIDRTIYNYYFTGAGTNNLIVFRKIYI
jgi:hypothetical protein